jgi:hypothetical protein
MTTEVLKDPAIEIIVEGIEEDWGPNTIPERDGLPAVEWAQNKFVELLSRSPSRYENRNAIGTDETYEKVELHYADDDKVELQYSEEFHSTDAYVDDYDTKANSTATQIAKVIGLKGKPLYISLEHYSHEDEGTDREHIDDWKFSIPILEIEDTIKEKVSQQSYGLKGKSLEDMGKELNLRSKDMEEQTNRLAEALDILDFSNYGLVLDWLKQFGDLSIQTDFINFDKTEILERFREAGFEVLEKGHYSDEENSKDYAEYIISESLNSITTQGYIPPVVNKFIEVWKEKFDNKEETNN